MLTEFAEELEARAAALESAPQTKASGIAPFCSTPSSALATQYSSAVMCR
jgi:hypothetical protein